MQKNRKPLHFSSFLTHILLLILAVFLFVLANPNIIINTGIGFLGFLIYIPVLLLIHKLSLKTVWIYGALYGVLCYGLYGYWLNNFHPLGLSIVCICYGIILAIVFLGLKFIDILFKKNSWIVQLLFICSYEYLKTLGFIGFSYGVTAYTLWNWICLIQIADTIGIFGLNFLVVFPSCYIYSVLIHNSKIKYGIIWCVVIVSCVIYGLFDQYKGNPKEYLKVIAIQTNETPWKNGIDEYRKNIEILTELTESALFENPDADIIVWPETAIAPSILENYYGKEDYKRYELIFNLLKYINSKNCTFVIGNANQTTVESTIERYNSAMVFTPGKNAIPPEPDVYSKIKLVPFIENFPYKKQFPGLYEKLLNGDTHLWDEGTEYSVFNIANFYFSTPICFEDTFGWLCRKTVKSGSRAFINLSSDAWSKSEVCQYQHLAIAVFRAVENRVPMVRSTTSGQTCIINQHGKVVSMTEPFCESYVVGKLPVYDSQFKPSVYTRFGDWAGILETVIFALILIIQVIRVIIVKLNKSA